jgi:plasmid stability protein
MGQVLIRNLDDAVVVSLKAKAKAAGLSLEQYLRDILTSEVKPTQSQLMTKAAEIRKTTKRPIRPPEDIIREDRDTNHGKLFL